MLQKKLLNQLMEELNLEKYGAERKKNLKIELSIS